MREGRALNDHSHRNVPGPGAEQPPRIWPASQRPSEREAQEETTPSERPPRQEWWERLRDRTSRSRIFLALRRVRAVASWFALLVVLVAVVVSPTVRTALGAWIGCMWLVVCWFTLARAKTVSWALTSGVFATGMPLALLIAMASLWVCSAAGVSPSSTAASIVVASLVEEVLKLTPLAVLTLVAPGRVRRFLVSDWIVLGVATGAAFEVVEEVTRRITLLNGGGSLLDSLLCPKGGVRQVECSGATTYSLSPFSGVAGNIFPYAGHAIITGLVTGAIGLGIALWRRARVHRGGYRAALQILSPVVPLWTWWVAVVDHMGRNASDYVMWLQTGGKAPSWPIEVTASLTGYGQGRGVILLLMLALAWVVDSRTLWGGGYVSALESDNYGNRWGPWRWRVWAGVPRNAFGRFLADGACLVSVVGVEWRWAWMTLMEAATFREPRLLLETPAKLRIAREEAARAELDPAPEQWWRARLAGLCAVVAGLLVIAMVPGLTRSMADSLGEGQPYWLAGLLDALGTVWESLSWEQKLGLMLLAGALILLSGGTLGLAFDIGMGVATVFGGARGAAALMRDPRGTVSRYLSTHTPAEIALDLAAAALTTVGGGAASAMGGQMARGAYAATREARYASYLWRTDRTAWRHYAQHARRRLIHDETGATSAGMWHPRNSLRADDVEKQFQHRAHREAEYYTANSEGRNQLPNDTAKDSGSTKTSANRTEAAATDKKGTDDTSRSATSSSDKAGTRPHTDSPLSEVQSMRGRPVDDVLDAIPDDWTVDTPRKEPDGIRFQNPHRNGEQIIYEPGKPHAKDPLHSGPYLRVSEGGKVYRIPLEGNPAL